MGIFNSLKKYDIVPKPKEFTSIVTKFNGVGHIKINAKLIVPEGYTLIIGKKGKACDIFCEGEHYFSYANLPIMCRKFGIDKNKQDKIPADFYFVKKELMPGKFNTYRKVSMGTKAYGLFSVKLWGVFSYKVTSITDFMQSLLNEFDYIKSGEAEEILERWVSEVSVDELEKQNFILKDVLQNSPIISDALKLKISKLFSVAGLELVDFKIVKYKLPRKYQKMQNEILNQSTKEDEENNFSLQIESNKQEKSDGVVETTDNNSCSGETAVPIENQRLEEPQATKQGYYSIDPIDDDVLEAKQLLKDFGIEKDQEPEIKNDLQEEQIEQEYNNSDLNEELKTLDEIVQKEETLEKEESTKALNYIPFGDFVIEENVEEITKEKAKNRAQEKTFVDLSMEQLYNSKECKRCLNCGMENSLNADTCEICGEKFIKGDIYEN